MAFVITDARLMVMDRSHSMDEEELEGLRDRIADRLKELQRDLESEYGDVAVFALEVKP